MAANGFVMPKKKDGMRTFAWVGGLKLKWLLRQVSLIIDRKTQKKKDECLNLNGVDQSN